MGEAALTLLTLAGVVLLFVTNKVPVEIAAVGSALVLYGLGIITLSEAFAGFADPAVLLIAGLFVVSEATAKTHVSNVLAQLQVRDRTQAVLVAYTSGLVCGRSRWL